MRVGRGQEEEEEEEGPLKLKSIADHCWVGPYDFSITPLTMAVRKIR